MNDRRHMVVVGMGYGDEGKGTMAEWFTRTLGSTLVCRFNGGAQAGHNVVLADGRHHTFAQFGSGTFAGARTHLSRHVLVNPQTLLTEASVLADKGVQSPLSRVSIERGALVTTHFHVLANRLREAARGDARHGSCGMGIGETAEDALLHPAEAIRIEDVENPLRLRTKLEALRARKLAAVPNSDDRLWGAIHDPDLIERTVRELAHVRVACMIVDESFLERELRAGPVVFEGAQGVLLDQDYGFHPHTTWSKTGSGNALELLNEAAVDRGEVTTVGVLRCFSTRHGAGPFVTEDVSCDAMAAGDHNTVGAWQGRFRIGYLDLVALRYASAVVGLPDEVVLTHCDRVRFPFHVCPTYRVKDPDPGLFFGGPSPREREVVAEIRYRRWSPIERQSDLGAALMRAEPILAHLASAEELLDRVRRAAAPVRYQSWGPRFEDKRMGSQ